jgi:hypothetical protein
MPGAAKIAADFSRLRRQRSFDFANVSLYYEYLRSMGLSSSGANADPIQKMLYVLSQEKSSAI